MINCSIFVLWHYPMNDSIKQHGLSEIPNQPQYKQVYKKNTSQEYTSVVEGEIIKQEQTKESQKKGKRIPNNSDKKTSRSTNYDKMITPTEEVNPNFLNYLSKLVQEKNQSHPNFSIMQLSKNTSNHTVGDYLQIKIILYDELGRPLSRGGDSVRIWGTGSTLKSNVAGDVIDHNNGSYTGNILLPWKGIINIHTRISETLQVGKSNVYLLNNLLRSVHRFVELRKLI